MIATKGYCNRSCSSEFQAIYGSIGGAKCCQSQRLPVLAVGSVVPTRFVLGSSAGKETAAPILCFSLHDLLRGWLLPFVDICTVNVHDCLRVDRSCVSQLEPGSAAAPSQAFPPGRLPIAVLPERGMWGSSETAEQVPLFPFVLLCPDLLQ